MRGRLAWAVALAAVATAGCDILDPASDEASLDLGRARQLWSDAGIRDYDLRVDRVCFCAHVGTVRVQVRGGARVATVAEADLPLEASALDGYPGVEGLFDLVARAVDGPADELRVTYHPVLGYPVDLWIDTRRSVDDDEVGYRAELVAPAAGG